MASAASSIATLGNATTPNHAATDEEIHLGAADLALTTEDNSKAEGTYWTRWRWKTGRNTAGTVELTRISQTVDRKRALREHASNHMAKLEGE